MRKIIDDDSVGNIEDHLPSDKTVKPKRQISDAQREHLNKIRELAMKKKSRTKRNYFKKQISENCT